MSEEFWAYSGRKRSAKNLKDKYENIKKKAKKQLAEEKRELYKTGGGISQCKVDAFTDRIVALLGISATGLQNEFDSDNNFAEAVISIIDLEEEPNTLPEETIEENEDSWTSWNPSTLKTRKSEKLRKIPLKRRKQIKNEDFCIPPEKVKLLEAQTKFFENEEKRAEEKHAWALEKHNWERDQAELKKQILRLDFEAKLNKLNI